MNEETWIFTFGFGHVHPDTGESLSMCYVVIPGDISSSRNKMVEKFGLKWAMQYPNKEAAGVFQFNLKEIPL